MPWAGWLSGAKQSLLTEGEGVIPTDRCNSHDERLGRTLDDHQPATVASATPRVMSVAVQPQHSQPENPRRQLHTSHSVATSSQPHEDSSYNSPYPDVFHHPAVVAYMTAHPRRTVPRFGLYLLLQTLGEVEGSFVLTLEEEPLARDMESTNTKRNQHCILRSKAVHSKFLQPVPFPTGSFARNIYSTPFFLPLHTCT
ncbi:hypothetical protein D9756_007865 [Leucocoprinus leucothites]|uniref:Uncharacterized protein n=1 Tax=Leucocoprinus leucothites TaxID=201217 RepID=A0A8H5FYF5_9AGAR|nr:hypothetical protein D9756_007865 [Leucoagaricus leucothites]